RPTAAALAAELEALLWTSAPLPVGRGRRSPWLALGGAAVLAALVIFFFQRGPRDTLVEGLEVELANARRDLDGGRLELGHGRASRIVRELEAQPGPLSPRRRELLVQAQKAAAPGKKDRTTPPPVRLPERDAAELATRALERARAARGGLDPGDW